MLEAASTVVVLSEGMRELLVQEKGITLERTLVIPPWAEPELRPWPRDEDLRAELGIGADELLVLSAGNLGIMHSLEPVVAAARRLDGRPVRFVFVASGVGLDHWRARLDPLANVLFLPRGPSEFFSRIVAACDAGLVPLSRGMERLAVPSRAYTLLSAGRPLLTVMDPRADLARLVSEWKCGFNAIDGTTLADWVELSLANPAELKESGMRARELYEARFTRQAALDRYVTLCGGTPVNGRPTPGAATPADSELDPQQTAQSS